MKHTFEPLPINDANVYACRLLLNGLFPANEWQDHYQTLKERVYADAHAEYAEQSLLSFKVRENSRQSGRRDRKTPAVEYQ